MQMVAVVSGSGLGLFNSSSASGNANVGRGRDQVFVNNTNGNLVVQSVDDTLSALGLDFAGIRTYNSQGLTDEDNNDQWRMWAHQRLTAVTGGAGVNTGGSSLKKIFGDGSEVTYTYNTTRSRYESTDGDGAHDFLNWNGTVWTWTDGSSRTTEEYALVNGTLRLKFSRDTDGNTVTYNYHATTFLLDNIVMAGSPAQTIFFDYSGSDITAIRVVSGGTQTLTRYFYDTSHRLRQVVVDLTPADNTAPLPDANGDGLIEATANQTYITTYTYDGTSKRIASIAQSDGSSVAFTYQLIDGQYRVKTYTDGEGRLTTLNYSLPSTSGGGTPAGWAPAQSLETSSLDVTDPTIAFDANGNGIAVWAHQGGEIAARRFDKATNTWGNIASVRTGAAASPEFGSNLSLSVDDNGNSVLAWLLSNDDTGQRAVYASRFNAAANSWSAPASLGSVASAAYVTIDASIRGAYAAVSWSNYSGANADLFVSRWNGTSWSSAMPVESAAGLADRAAVAVDAQGRVSVVWRQAADAVSAYNVFANRYDGTSWSGATPLESTAATAGELNFGFDGSGNGIVMWTQGNDVLMRRYTASNNTWAAAPPPLDSGSTAIGAISLSVDFGGNAIAAWVQSDGTIASCYASRYDVASNAWSPATLVESLAAAVNSIDTAIAGNQAAVIMGVTGGALQDRDLYAARWNGTSWTTDALSTGGSFSAGYATQIAIDSQGNAVQIGMALDANVGSAVVRRYNAVASGGGGPSTTTYLQTDVVDALGRTTTYTQDSLGRVTSRQSPTVSGVRLTTSYGYDADGNLTTITEDPTGLNRVIAMSYDALGNMLSSRDSGGNTVARTYNNFNQLLTEVKYLVPDPDGGGSAQPGTPLTTRLVYDGTTTASESHLRFLISADGRVTEHVYNTAGQRTTTLNYLGALYTGTAFAESDLVTWTGARDKTQLERTEYLYDPRGLLSTFTSFVTTDGTGAGTGTPSVTKFVYDQRGQLLQTITPLGSANTPNPATPNLSYATTYIYDGLGRVLSATSWNSSSSLTTTLNAYDDANRRTAMTLASGLVTTFTYNRDGELVTVSNGTAAATTSLGAVTHTYDAGGRLRVTTDQTGVKTYCFYDEANRKIGYVDGDGSLTEHIYNRADQLIKTVRYSTLLTGATQTALSGGSWNTVAFSALRTEANATPARNQITRSVYDAVGRMVFAVDELGAITKNVYDGANRLTDQVRFFNIVTIAASVDEVLPAGIAVAAHASDRRTRFFYNADGQLAGTLDAAGFLKENVYDAAGHLITQLGYYNASDASRWATGALDTLRPGSAGSVAQPDAARDIRTRSFYDGQGRKVGELDGERYLTELVYDVAGNVTQSIRYDRVLTDTNGTATFATLRAAATVAGTATHSTAFTYDGAGRVLTETNFESTQTVYAYDSVGNVVTATFANGTTEGRTTRSRYDLLGRVTQELTAEGNAALTALGASPTQTQIDTVWNSFSVTYAYDNASRRISATVRPNDSQTNTTYFYYDNDGRLRFELDPRGRVTENRYNALGQLVDRIQYWRTVTITGPAGGLLTATLISQLSSTEISNVHEKTTLVYSLRGEQTVTATAADAMTIQSYNSFGELETRNAGTGFTAFTHFYDNRGALKRTERAGTVYESRVYDAFGRLKSVTDARGNTSTRTYDRLGREVTTQQAGDANASLTTYDAFSRTVRVRDKLLNETVYQYTDSTRTLTVTTPEGIVLTTVRNRHGDTLSVAANGNTTSYTYDLNGRQTGASDNLGSLESRAYDRAGRQIEARDARGIITTFVYDAANRVLTRTVDSAAGGLALVTSFAHDAQNRWLTVTEPGSRVTRTEYDRDGRVAAVVLDPSGVARRTEYQYDAANHNTLVIEAAGTAKPRRTLYVFDALGRRTDEYVDPLSLGGTGSLDLRTQYRYDANGNVTRKIDALGNSTWYVYDTQDRLVQTIDALGGVTQLTYDAQDRITVTRRYFNTVALPTGDAAASQSITTTVNDRVTRSVYDRDGREKYTLQTLSASGTPGSLTEQAVVTERSFDAAGNVTRTRVYRNVITVPGTPTTSSVTTALTAAQNDPAVLHADDRVEWTAYDVRGRAVFVVDSSGAVAKSQYDACGNVVATIAYAERVALGNLMTTASLTTWSDGASIASNAANRITRFWYDTLDRLRFALDAEGYLVETRHLDGARQTQSIVYAGKPTVPANATLAQLVTAAGAAPYQSLNQTTTQTRDTAGRVVQVTDADLRSEYFGYDALGNKTSFVNKKGASATDAAFMWTYEYDANGRLIYERSPAVDVTTVTESVPGAGVLNASSTNARVVTRFEYDSLGNLRFRREAYGTTRERFTEYRYDALGRQTRVVFPTAGVYNTSGNSQLGNGSAVARTEDNVALFSEVAYDSLGNAFRNRDVAGSNSYKAYDALGRVTHEVDALGFVTSYRFDTFGNRTELTRHVNALSSAIPGNATSLLASDVTSRLVTSSSTDRTIVTGYDRLNRIVSVTQPSVANFEPNAGSSGGTTFTAGATTLSEYDAFGTLVRSRELLTNAPSYADTYYYSDRLGQKTAEVDPLGYLTIYEYDETGDLKRSVEYARPRTGTLNTTTYGDAVATTRAVFAPDSPEAAGGYDRVTSFTYDLLNRKKTETRIGIEFSTLNVAATDVTSTTGDQVTSYDYDYVGNQTRMTQAVGGNSLVTYTYYDVLGRVIAVAEPARDPGDGVTLIPYTRMARDAFGNLVQQTIYGGGADSIPASGLPVPKAAPAASSNRVSTFLLDGRNNAIRSSDPLAFTRYASYNARGEVAKEWQIVTNPGDPATSADDRTETLVTLYEYDALGRQTSVKEPQRHEGATSILVTKASQYNAFGEITYQGVTGAQGTSGQQEYFDYDRAGRLWRTNSGDGVNKVYLYNLAGQMTAELRSKTENLASSALASAQDVVSNVPAANLMRTETRYDARGMVVEQRLPVFTVENGVEQVASDVRLATIASGAAYVNWSGIADSSVTIRFEYRALGSTSAYATLNVETLPESRLGANVHSLYNQTYEYRISYRRNTEATAYAESAGTFRVARSVTTTLSIAQAAPDPAAEVSALAVTQNNGMIIWAAPADTSVVAKLRYKVAGSPATAWQPELTATRSGANFEINARTALADAGNYDYEIEYTRNSSVIAKRTGQLFSAGSTAQRNVRVDTSSENPLTTFSQLIPVPNMSGRLMTWPGPGDASITPTFEYKLTSASSYTSSLSIDRSTSTWNVNTAAVANDSYHYRIQYKIGNRVVAEQIGTFNIAANGTVTTTTAGVTRDTAPPATELVSNIAGTGGVLGASASNVVSQTGESGYDHRYPTTVYRWFGSNSVNLSWASVGSQPVRVVLDYSSVAYQTSPSVARSVEQVFGTGGSGVTFAWGSTSPVYYSDTQLITVPGGIRSNAAIRVRVYARDSAGNYTVMLRDSATAVTTPASLTWSAPADAALTPTFNYYNGSSWVTRATTRSGNAVSVDLSDLAQGNYDYELRYTKSGAVSVAAGTFQISGATAIKLTQGNSTQDPSWLTPTTSGSRVNWSLQPPAGTTVRFNWFNGSTWVTRGHDTDGTNYSVDMTGMAAGSYLYDIYYVRSGESYAYARVTGTLTVGVTTQTVQGALSIGTPTTNVVNATARITPVTVTGDTISWNRAKFNTADEIRVRYTLNGTTYTAAVAGSGPNYSASFTQLPSGTTAVSWLIEYLRSGETDPYAKATGQATFTLYYSQSASVTSVTPQQGLTGYDHRYPLTVYQWSGSNSTNLNWASVGSQPVRVVLDYFTLGYVSSTSVAANVTQDFASGGTGVTLGWGSSNTRWYDWQEFEPIKGGIDATRPMVVKVYGRDAGGNYTILLRDSTVVLPPPQITISSQAPVYPSGVQQVSAPVDLGNGSFGWTTAPAAGATVLFKYNGIEVATAAYGSGRQVNLSALADGTYTYEITYTNGTPGVQNPYARATGTFTLARNPGPAGQLDFSVNTALAADPLVNGADPLDAVVAIEQMNVPSNPDGGYLLQETTGTPSIAATYRIEWNPLVGKYTRGGGFIADYSVSTGRYLFWSDPPTVLADATKVFEWRVAGATGGWTSKTIEKIFDGQGNRFLGVNVGSMPPGSFEYRIRYMRAGETNSFAVRTGAMTNPATVGSVIADTTANSIRNRTDLLPRAQQSYDRWGNIISITDARNAVTNLRYDQLGQLIEKKLPTVEIVAISAASGAVSAPANGRPTQRNYYDVLGRLIATRDANGSLSTARLNNGGQTLRATNADGTYKSYVYDAFGNRTLQIDERSFRTRYTYNALNLLEKTDQEAVENAFAGNITGAIITQSYLYDQAGRRIVDTDGKGMSTRYWYDLLGNVVKRVSASNAIMSYEYDLLGNKTREIDAIGGVKNWSYDYFGRLVTHVELGTFTYTPNVSTHTWTTTYAPGYAHTYEYDFAGLNLSHTSTGGINLKMSYDAAGHLMKTVENSLAVAGSGLQSVKRETRYAYDALGRHSREQSVVDGVKYSDARISYDAAGRMKSVWDIGAGVTFSYDANGNRTRIQAESSSQNNAQAGEMHQSNAYDRWWNYLSTGWFTNGKTLDQGTTDLWYKYDVMNRLVLSRGWNVNGVVVADSSEAVNVPHRSIELGYDATGNRNYHKQWGMSAKYSVSGSTYSMVDGFSVEESRYDGLGRVVQMKKDGMVVGTYVYDKTSRQTFAETSQISGTALGTGRTYSFYGNDGRLYSQRIEGNTTESPSEFRVQSEVTFGESQLVLDWNGNTPRSFWTNGYDAAGVLRRYEVAVRKVNGDVKYTSTYKLDYRAGESYQEVSNDHTATGEDAPFSASTQKRYDVNGNLLSVQRNNDVHLNRFFVYDGNGQMLVQVRAQSDGTLPNNAFANAAKTGNADQWGRYFYANGASVGNMGALPSFFNNQPSQSWYFDVDDGSVSEANLSAPSQIVAVKGDTLRRIALRVYGDANLWYILADENGIAGPDEVLPEGMTIRLPNRVVSLQNSADVFKPFDAGRVIGDTSPVLDFPTPPPPKKGCGMLVMFLMVVVAIVVTVFTAGAAATAAGAVASSAAGTTAAATATGVAGIMSTGAAALTGSLAAGAGGIVAGLSAATVAIGSAAIGAAVGSAVSQGIGIALGAQDKFDWKGVATAAIGGAITAGLGGGLVPGGNSAHIATRMLATAANSAISNALTQGVSMAVGLQKKFDWRSVAQSAVAAPIASEAGRYIGGKVGEMPTSPGQYNLAKFASDATGTIVTAGVRSAMGGRFDVKQVAADVFGNAVGNSIVAGAISHSTTRRAQSILDRAGYESDKKDHRTTLSFVRGLIDSKLSDDDIFTVLDFDGMQSWLYNADAATEGGISVQTSSDRAGRFAERELRRIAMEQSSASVTSPDGQLLDEIRVTGIVDVSDKGPSGSSITRSIFSSGIGFVDTMTRFEEEHPFLASVAFNTGKVLLTGGPLKSVVNKAAKGVFGDQMDQARSKVAGFAQERTSSFVTAMNFEATISIGVIDVPFTSSMFGTGAGEVAGGLVETFLDGSVKDISARGKRVSDLGNGPPSMSLTGSASGPGGMSINVTRQPTFNQKEFDRKTNRLQTLAEKGRLNSNIPHGVTDAERRALTRQYRSGLEDRINRRWANDPVKRDNALARLRNSDIDHIQDLQLGGTNTRSNLKTLDSQVNQAMGREISTQLPRGVSVPVTDVIVVNPLQQ